MSMDIREIRKIHFEEFKKGVTPIHLILSDNHISEIPSFAFRKIDSNRIAILAWREKEDAEKWMKEGKIEMSSVIECYFPRFVSLLDGLSSETRKNCTIELI